MPHSIPTNRPGALARIAGVSLLSLLAAACAADTQRFAGLGGTDNMSTGSLPPSDVPGGSSPSYGGGSYGSAGGGSMGGSSAVQTSSLPPPSGASSQSSGHSSGFAGVRPDAMSGSANGWTASGGATVSVGQGDTVQTIADRYGVPPAAIRAANNIGGGGLTPGSSVVIPVYNPGASSVASASSAARGAAQPVVRPVEHAATSATRAASHVAAAPGKAMQTAQGAQRNVQTHATAANDRTAQVIAASRAAVQQPVKPGQPPRSLQQQAQTVAAQPGQAAQKVAVQAPAAAKAQTAAQAQAAAKAQAQAAAQAKAAQAKTAAQVKPTAEAPAKAVAQAQPKAPAVEQKAPERQQVAVAAPEAPAAKEEAAQASGGSFRWPARGRIIQGYNGRNGSEGINIALPEGTPVKAAEGGVVAYAGSELKGYGNLVLIRHENGWVSAYANNGELTVKRGDKVSRGQTVAKSGQSGNVSTPQLHFELRKGSTPVDPMPHLAGG